MKEKKIAVLMGGPSAEREVSLRTGKAIHKALLSKGYNAVAIDLEPSNLESQMKSNKIDVVFNAIHGLYGEDGCVQGQLNMLGIKYTGSGVLASAVAMDKIISKRLFISDGILTPKFIILNKQPLSDCVSEIKRIFSLPVVIKPPAQGSSVGVEIVNDLQKLEESLQKAFIYSKELLIEEFITGRELTVSITNFDGEVRALPIIEIVPESGVYDYSSKYTVGATNYIVPAHIEDKITEEVQRTAVKAFSIMGCEGVARVDIMLSETGEAYVLEVNTVPGMTETSLVPKAANAAGISFADLCEKILLEIKNYKHE